MIVLHELCKLRVSQARPGLPKISIDHDRLEVLPTLVVWDMQQVEARHWTAAILVGVLHVVICRVYRAINTDATEKSFSGKVETKKRRQVEGKSCQVQGEKGGATGSMKAGIIRPSNLGQVRQRPPCLRQRGLQRLGNPVLPTLLAERYTTHHLGYLWVTYKKRQANSTQRRAHQLSVLSWVCHLDRPLPIVSPNLTENKKREPNQ